MNGAAAPTLEACDVSFSYSGPVVRNFSLVLAAGSVTGIIGPNGCGKTTVMRLLAGILRPRSGNILWQGTTRISDLPRKEVARRIAMVPQNAGDGSQLTVTEFALQGRAPHLALFGFESTQDHEITESALEMVQLLQYREARVCELSGGEKQRLLLARALVQQTRVLLLDELTANLDINYQVELMRLVCRLTRERRLATLVVSHEVHLLSGFADRIVLMSDGTIRCQGTVAEAITRDNLNFLFHQDFLVRPSSSGRTEVLPVLEPRRPS